MNKQDIKDFIESLSTRQMIDLHNVYREEVNYPDDTIYPMYEFNNHYEGKEPLDIVNACQLGNINSSDDYFTYDGYANPYSFDNYDEENNVSNLKDEIIEYIYNEGIDAFSCLDIDFDDLVDED